MIATIHPLKRTGTHHTGTTSSMLSTFSSPHDPGPALEGESNERPGVGALRGADEVVVDQRRAVVGTHLTQHHEVDPTAVGRLVDIGHQEHVRERQVREQRPRRGESQQVVDRGIVE
jgi:hypothetical protein